MKPHKQKVEEAMSAFDFDAAQAEMQVNEWPWVVKRSRKIEFAVPTVDEMRETASRLLDGLNRRDTNCMASGRLRASRDDELDVYHLEFNAPLDSLLPSERRREGVES